MDSNRRSSLRNALKVALITASLTAGTAAATCYCHGTLIVKKFYDANANGIWDSGEPALPGWPMTVTSDSKGIDLTHLTNIYGNAVFTVPGASDYAAEEGTPNESNWVQSAPVDGSDNPINPITDISVTAGYTTRVKFGNYCTKPSGGRTPGFWSNQNGLNKLLDGGTYAPELALLSGLNLVDADGNPFDPTTYSAFRTWLLDSNAVNMSYKLSSHLAAMVLNVEAGFVNGNAVYGPYGGTINDLIAEANTALGNDGFTPAGDEPNRSYQEDLKNFLAALNNNGSSGQVVSPTPCKYTFGEEPY